MLYDLLTVSAEPAKVCIGRLAPKWISRRRATGGIRGAALDAEEEVKHQAIILVWKAVAKGTPKMQAYREAAEDTGMHWDTVRGYVTAEDRGGIDAVSPSPRLEPLASRARSRRNPCAIEGNALLPRVVTST